MIVAQSVNDYQYTYVTCNYKYPYMFIYILKLSVFLIRNLEEDKPYIVY